MDKQLDFITEDSAFQPYQVRNLVSVKVCPFSSVKSHVFIIFQCILQTSSVLKGQFPIDCWQRLLLILRKIIVDTVSDSSESDHGKEYYATNIIELPFK